MESWQFHFDYHLPLLLLVFFVSFQLELSVESDSITAGETLSGNRTLTSQGEVFEMGFFAPQGKSHNYYIGIWYMGLPMPEKTVVWVANRDHPVSEPYYSKLELGEDGHLVLLNSNGLAVWSTDSNSTAPPLNSTVGTLGDDGNFVIRKGANDIIWQSFEHPTDTWLPGAKFGYDKDTGITTVLKSWQGINNPSTSLYSIGVTEVYPSFSEAKLLLKNGSDEYKFCVSDSIFRSDEFNVDLDFQLAYGCFSKHYFDSYVVMTYSSYPTSCRARYLFDVTGQIQLYVWWDYMENWHGIYTRTQTCDAHSGNKEDKGTKAKQSGKKNATWIVLIILTWLALMLVGITVVRRIVCRKDSGTSFKVQGGDTLKQYKLRDLQRATKNFKEKLGEGGFSTVYKGEFPDSTFIAVKELHDQFQDEKQLRAELNTVGLIQHKNLVRLLGFCLQDSKRFLVYDYMPNGSLESHLFERGSDTLDWGTRYNIALGAAKGLVYLHEECRDCIIHCDIKPENILLDAEFNPKVSDFGLAKLFGRNSSRVLTTIRGTRGYLAPDWFSGGPVTTKVDVYSYGQVLFEIISGRRNLDLLNDELDNYFPALVLNALNDGADVVPLVDSKLEGEVNVEELNRACKVASWCIQDDEKDRPTMTQVVQILEGHLDAGIPPIPQFFQSIAEIIRGSEAYSTPSTLPTSFYFQPPAQPIQHIP